RITPGYCSTLRPGMPEPRPEKGKTARLPCRVAQRDRGNSLFDGPLPLCYNRSSLKNGIFYAVSLKNVRRYKEMADRRSTIEDVAKRAGVSKDRKSTRLNSSHVSISYAVFCLKKKNRKR